MKKQEINKNSLGASIQYWHAGKSINAQRAEREGRFSKTNFIKEYGFDPSKIATASEWHHTSKFFNKTDYYSLDDVFESLWDMTNEERKKFLKNKKLKELWGKHKIDKAKNELNKNLEKGNFHRDYFDKQKNKNKNNRYQYLRNKYFLDVDNQSAYFDSIFLHAFDLSCEFFVKENSDSVNYEMLKYKEPVYELARKIFDYMQLGEKKHSKSEARKYFNEHPELITDILNKPLGEITMITKENYYSEIERIGITNLPKIIQERHKVINELTDAIGKGLEKFTDAEISEYFIDKQFEALEKLLNKNSPKEKEAENKSEITEKSEIKAEPKFKKGSYVLYLNNVYKIKGMKYIADNQLTVTDGWHYDIGTGIMIHESNLVLTKKDENKYDIIDINGNFIEKALTEDKVIEFANTSAHYDIIDTESEEISTFAEAKKIIELDGDYKIIPSGTKINKPDKKPKFQKGDKSSKTKTEKENTNSITNFVELVTPEIKFIQRFVALHGKTKTQEQILSFLNSLQKAIVTKVIRKTSPYKKEIEYIQENLILVYNKMGSKIKIEIEPERLQTLNDFAISEKQMLSITYVKQYISLHGKTGIKDKAESLLKRINKAVESGKIPENCPYMNEIKDIQIHLNEVVNDKANRLTVEAATLNSLNGICNCKNNLSGRMPNNNQKEYKFYVVFDKKYILGANEYKNDALDLMNDILDNYPEIENKIAVYTKSFLNNVLKINPSNNNNWRNYNTLHGLGFFSDMLANIAANFIYDIPAIKERFSNFTNKITTTNNSVTPQTQPKSVQGLGKVNSMELKNMNFKNMGLKGKYAQLMGDPVEPCSIMIYGEPGSGKSTIVIDIAKTFASDYNKKIAFVAKEEGIGSTIQEKFKRLNAFHPNIDIYENHLPERINNYDFIIIDSVNEMGISYEELCKLNEQGKQNGVSFIYLFKSTKNGSFRGSQEFEHLVQVSLKVANGIATTQKSRFGGHGSVKIFNNETQKIAKFPDYQKAEAYRNKISPNDMITKGDDNKYWVISPEYASLLKQQGFQIL